MTYSAPVAEMAWCMRHVAELDRDLAAGLHDDLTAELAGSVLEEAGRFAGDAIAPLNRAGDVHGAPLRDGVVSMPPGFREVYRAWTEAGWNGLAGPPDHGGQGLPLIVAAACTEMWNAASMSFGLGPLLTVGAVEALHRHGSADLKERYLAKLVSGEWTGTMNLTEPQAGSDLALLRTRAERAGDGTYRIRGEKIYITWGEHDLADNIVHLVLARLPDAPAGTRGISLFCVPKVLPDGSRNDLRCTGVEHKLGIHGSPTCTMLYGAGEGAVGWLVGEEHRGLLCMFTMMNSARLNVGLQGVAIGERAYQAALGYARDRRQGKAPGSPDPTSAIVEHPDIRRTLLTMKALVAAARAICYRTAAALDRSRLAVDGRGRAEAFAEASLLTPVAKAFSSDIGVEVASLGVQVHGGMGFVEETGAAQHLRDARILPIYEGTNGIQAIDLVLRKLPLDGGRAVRREIAKMRAVVRSVTASGGAGFGATATRLREAVEALDRATSHLLGSASGKGAAQSLAAATPYLRLFGLVCGGAGLARSALAAQASLAAGDNDPAQPARIALCRFFAENLVVAAGGLADTVVEGSGFLDDAAALVLAG